MNIANNQKSIDIEHLSFSQMIKIAFLKMEDAKSKKSISKRRLSLIYDELYKEAEQVLEKYNPCKFKNGKCMARDNCCEGCRHLSKKGCKVKALACKLWLCDEAYLRFSICDEELEEIKDRAIKFGFLDYNISTGSRESKTEMIERAWNNINL